MLYILDRYISPIILYITIYYRSKPKIMDTNLLINEVKVSTKTHNLPIFPHFKKITIEDIRILYKLIQPYPFYSEFSPVTLYAWSIDSSSYFTTLNDNLILLTKDEFNVNDICTLIGVKEINKTIEELQGYNLKLIPSITARQINPSEYKIIEDTNNGDYIYDVNEIISLKGSHYKAKRYQIKKFFQKYPNIEIEKSFNNINFTDILNLMKRWGKNKNLNHNELQLEQEVIKRIKENYKLLKVSMVGFYDNRQLIGFVLSEQINNNWSLIHFFCADTKYQYIYDALFYNISLDISKLKLKKINLAQDLGIQGLRHYKESWRPYTIHKKYSLIKIT